jgi:hypothetical protein
MAASGADEDLGWEVSGRTLLMFVPGYVRLERRRRRSTGTWDGLAEIRDFWLTLTVAVLLFGVVVALVMRGAQPAPAGVWVTVLVAASVLSLIAARTVGRRPLDCRDLASLGASYRSRFFLQMACYEALALLAFIATFSVGRWWIYWAFLPVTLYGFVRTAPTTKHLIGDLERLRLAGCNLSLVRALRTRRTANTDPGPTEDGAGGAARRSSAGEAGAS